MYHDEQNLYHYTYRRDGTEPGQRYDTREAGQETVIQEMRPVKKNRMGLKLTALALSCAILGGAVGGGTVWAAGRYLDGGTAADGTSGLRTETERETPETDVTPELVKAAGEEGALTDAQVYAANVDSVVAISTQGQTVVSNGLWETQQPTTGAGSGFILTTDGYIVTNYHVVDGASAVKVTLYSGDTYDAEMVGGEEDYDIAVIKVNASGLHPVTLGDSTELRVGDRVLAIGNPLGELTFSQTGGMVSSVNRTINVDGIPFNMIQTDASINPGNSGGPLFNQSGEVVGIVSAKYTRSSSGTNAEGLGFAIPINDVIAMVQDIMTNGYVANKPYLGIFPQSMTEQMAAQYRYSVTSGVFVCSTEDGSAAEKAGLRMGDVITKVDDTEIKTVNDLNAVKKKYSAGDACELTVYRAGEMITVDLVWGTVPPEEQQQQTVTQPEEQLPQNGGQYGNGYDIFDYFFGNRW